jgi:hypothetical protein
MSSSRKPAPIVSCEYCNWKGSARGLFTHVRLSHPGIDKKPPIAQLVHPLDNSRSISGTKVKRKRKRYGESNEAEGTALMLLAVGIIVKMIEALPPTSKKILQSEGINSSYVRKLGGFE